MPRFLHLLLAIVVSGMLLAGQQPYPVSAGPAEPEQAADQQHGVARVSFLGGEVNLQRGGSTEMVAAVVNAPLLSQDRLQTSSRSFAEVQLDGSTVVRLAENTDVGFAELQAGRARLQFGAGSIIFRFLRDSQAQVDIETPSVAVHPLGPADLRLTVLENGSTEVTVRAGAVDLYGPRGTERLEAPRSVEVRANATGPEFQETSAAPRDSFDEWSAGRDRELLASQSYQYTGGEMAGVADLDANGAWVGSQYGPVWAPQTQSPDWAPYSNGQWVDEPYYGWTWVDAEPWGWAPFHYGRWFWNGGHGWCWWPGARGYRQSWGPAYVGFFGYGGQRGGLGWVALAPYEGFHAWWGGGGYRGGAGYYAPHAGLFGSYRNAYYRGSAVGASIATFGSFRGRFGPLSRETIGSATILQGRLPVNGSAYRFRFTDRQAVANPRLGVVASRSYVRGPDYRVRSSGSQYWSRPGANTGGYASGSQYGPPASSGTGGWQHFGDPRVNGNNFSPNPGNRGQGFVQGRNESGWHSFGEPARPRSSGPSTGYRSFGNPQTSERPSYRPSAPSYRQPPQGSPQFQGFRGNSGGQSHGGGGQSQGGSHGGGSPHSSGGGGGRHR